MARFRFSARDKKGMLRRGTIEAETVSSLVRQLRDRGLRVMSVSPIGHKPGSGSVLRRIVLIKSKVKPKDLAIFTRQFAMMLEAGVDIVKSLSIIEEQTDHVTLKEVIGEIREEVERGRSLAEAMGMYPKVFDRFYIHMMEAAQTSGSYENVLMDIATDIEKRERIKGKVKSSLMPSLTTLGFALMLCFSLIRFVVPQFVDLYNGVVNLPRPTQILLDVSRFIQGRGGAILLLGIISTAIILKKAISNGTGRYIWDEMKFKMPLFGPLIRKIAIGHFARTLGLLLGNGVDYLLALDIVANASKNVFLSQILRRARDQVNRGMLLSKSLMESGIFPPMVIQMISSGEEAARLPEMLERISRICEEEIDRSVERLSGMVIPIMTLIIGAIVGGILLSLYLP
ncbi:type II secretion system F family protein [Candidatus Poribacteria bacterium]|nr:type II secretion system F family protein [Candidatus Poribacteria bacterium]